MTQITIKIHNPTGTRVAYLARDLRVNVPSGESTHTVASNKLGALKTHLAKHYPLLKVVADSPAAEPEAASGGDEPAEKPTSGKSGRRGKGGRKAGQAKAESPDTEQTSEAQE